MKNKFALFLVSVGAIFTILTIWKVNSYLQINAENNTQYILSHFNESNLNIINQKIENLITEIKVFIAKDEWSTNEETQFRKKILAAVRYDFNNNVIVNLQKSKIQDAQWGQFLDNLVEINSNYLKIQKLHTPSMNNYSLIEGVPQAPILKITFINNKSLYQALIAKEYLSSINYVNPSFNTTAEVVNEQGQIISHSQIEYVGKPSTNNRLIAEAISSLQMTGSIRFQDNQNQIQLGHYLRSDKNNLIFTMRQNLNFKNNYTTLIWQLIFIGFGILLIAYFLISYINSEKNYPNKDNFISINSQQEKQSNVESPHLKTINVKFNETEEQLYKKIININLEKLTQPILSLYSNLQMSIFNEKNHNSSVHEKLISKDVEAIKNYLDDLRIFSDKIEFEYKRVSVEEVIKKIVNKNEQKLKMKNINLNMQFDKNCFIKSDKFWFEKSLESMIHNSITQLDRTRNKQLDIIVKLSQDDKILLNISDNGQGYDEESMTKIFSPFNFHTSGVSDSNLLSLGAVQSFFKKTGCHFEITSVQNEKTFYSIILDKYLMDFKMENIDIEDGAFIDDSIKIMHPDAQSKLQSSLSNDLDFVDDLLAMDQSMQEDQELKSEKLIDDKISSNVKLVKGKIDLKINSNFQKIDIFKYKNKNEEIYFE